MTEVEGGLWETGIFGLIRKSIGMYHTVCDWVWADIYFLDVIYILAS